MISDILKTYRQICRCVPIAVLIVFAISATTQLFAASNATTKMEEALKLRAANDLEGAINNLKSALATAQTQAQRNLAAFMLGDCLLEARKPTEAAEVYKCILEGPATNEEIAEALYRSAQCRRAMRDYGTAKKLCDRVVKEYAQTPYRDLACLLSKTLASESSDVSAAIQKQSTSAAITERSSSRSSKSVTQPSWLATTHLDSPKKPEPSKKALQPVQIESMNPRRETAKSQDEIDVSDLLNFPQLSNEEREALASQILHDSEVIKKFKNEEGVDDILMRIAEAAARFGEPVEACKTYDRILTEFPTSKHVERAYFESIRLRAVLGLKPAVVQWGEAFLKNFPKSWRTGDVKRLISWARSGMNSTTPSGVNERNPEKNTLSRDSKASQKVFDPESDPRYRQAKRRLAENRFALAMNDFQALAAVYPDVPMLWWELAVVQIQLQRYAEAEKSLEKLLALQPDNQDARSLLGYVHYHQKDYTQAAADYKQAGESESEGLTFFDSQTAARRMERSSKKLKPSSTHEGGSE